MSIYDSIREGMREDWRKARAYDDDAVALLKEILNSDMAQREEDEGNESPLLNRIRTFLGG